MFPICMSYLEKFRGDAEFRDSGFGVRPTIIIFKPDGSKKVENASNEIIKTYERHRSDQIRSVARQSSVYVEPRFLL
jgi:hypothetical protein